MSQENVDVVRQGWDAWLRGDPPGLFRLFHPDIALDISHFHEWPESAYHGLDGAERFLTDWLDVWPDLNITVEEVIAAPDGRVVSLIVQRGRGRHSGVEMELEMAVITTIRDGKIVRLENWENRSQALEAAGLSE
jgi:ketosteroid isomerase-like protein